MYIKRVYGKSTLEVSGTEEQTDKAIKTWLAEVEDTRRFEQLCEMIRAKAKARAAEFPNNSTIVEVFKALIRSYGDEI